MNEEIFQTLERLLDKETLSAQEESEIERLVNNIETADIDDLACLRLLGRISTKIDQMEAAKFN